MDYLPDLKKKKEKKKWEVHHFYWGTAVKNRETGEWTNLFLKPDGTEINLDNKHIIIHENGLEFIGGKVQ